MTEQKQERSAENSTSRRGKQTVDISEKGRGNEGDTISSNRRLFMQFLAFGGCTDVHTVQEVLIEKHIPAVLYEDVNDAQGIGMLTFSESEDYFLDTLRPILTNSPFTDLTSKPEYTMFGRTYTIGYENDLDEVLVHRPSRRVLDPKLPWAVWYPLRRAGTFEQLSSKKQNAALMEHGGIGRAFGTAGLAYDIRLACHGMDKHDNDFVVALLGAELAPLSKVVQEMRKTVQTSQHMQKMGPFFIGRAAWQSPLDE